MIRAFVIDDHTIFRSGLRRLLLDEPDIRMTGEARSGPEAIEALRGGSFDLVLLDITLPELDGFQVCEQLRAEHGSDMGIIMLTARGREAEVAKGLALGADAYVTKPFSTRDLVETVHKLLGTPRCSGG